MSGCGPGADPFIEQHFKDCVYNVRDYIGFGLGLAAIVFWLVAQLPQYYRNYKTKSAEALSPWFLAQWLLGDTFNLIGALLQGQQLPTTVYTAMYFVVADMFMMMQYIYYGALQRRREAVLKLQARRRHHHHNQRRRQQPSQQQQQPRPALGASSVSSPARWHEPADGGAQPAGNDGLWQRQQQDQQHQQQQAFKSSLCGTQGADDELPLLQLRVSNITPQPLSAQQHLLPFSTLDSTHLSDCGRSSSRSSSSSSGDGTPRPLHSTHGLALCAPGLPVSCAAAAAAAAPPLGLSWLRLPGVSSSSGSSLHFGSSRSALAVGILVSLALVSLMAPASTTFAMHPVRLATAGSGDGSSSSSSSALPPAAARAIQAGAAQQQQQHAMHSTASGSSSLAAAAAQPSPSSQGSRARRHRLRGNGDSGDDPVERSWSFIVGTGLGYVSSVLYLCSRVSQIHKNHSRKSAEGLAIVMFMMAVCANLCTGTSIVTRTFTWRELTEQLPWIIGSLGTITLDMVILWQSRVYGKAEAAAAAAAAEHAAAAGGGGGGVGARGGSGSSGLHHRHHHHHHGHHHHHTDDDAAGAEASDAAERQHLLDERGGGAVLLLGAPDAARSSLAGGRSAMGRRHAAAGEGEVVPLLPPPVA